MIALRLFMTVVIIFMINTVNIVMDMGMKVQQRHARLVATVRRNGTASVDELAACLGASRETIRRDLTELAKHGRIQKIHGGATIVRIFGEGPFQQRMSENADAKMRIAAAAAGLFTPGETLFIDTGSTTLYLAEELAGKPGLTIVTNSTEIAKTISNAQSGNRVYLLGGEFSADNRQTVGTMVATQIRSFRAHHAVLTIGALDDRSGAMDFNIEEAQVAQVMHAQSARLTVLVDHSKFGALASFEVCPLDSIDRLVCDQLPADKIVRKLKAAGCEIVLAA